MDNTDIALQEQLDPHFKAHRIIVWTIHTVVLILSLALIVFISYDTFKNIPFLQNEVYMTFQFWVCMVFLLDFFVELALSRDKWQYLRYHWFFFLISIPYLNIIGAANLEFTPHTLYFIRFIPLVRGAYSLALVVGYFSSNRAMSLLSSYAAILLSIIYFASLIFFQQEHPVNSDVTDYWSSLWWACMNVTTIGCYINPMTIAGKICAVVLATMGMMMLPLFTVYITTKVSDYNARRRKQDMELRQAFAKEQAENKATSTPSAPSDSSDQSDTSDKK